MQPRPDPRRQLILAHLEHPAGRLNLRADEQRLRDFSEDTKRLAVEAITGWLNGKANRFRG